MRIRRFQALAALALAPVALAGCSSSQSASSDQQFQMVRVTEEMLDQSVEGSSQSVILLGASDDWGSAVYSYYLAYLDQHGEDALFASAEPELSAD